MTLSVHAIQLAVQHWCPAGYTVEAQSAEARTIISITTPELPEKFLLEIPDSDIVLSQIEFAEKYKPLANEQLFKIWGKSLAQPSDRPRYVDPCEPKNSSPDAGATRSTLKIPTSNNRRQSTDVVGR